MTDDVIITEERIAHIKEHHPGDYEKYGKDIKDIIEDPDHILEDNKNRDTILYMKTIERHGKNIQIVVKLNTNKKDKSKKNSILTLWKMKDSTYRQYIRNRKNLWSDVDKDE